MKAVARFEHAAVGFAGDGDHASADEAPAASRG
jgi:hypothetical protein